MIFTSQSGLLDSAKEAEWDSWYVEHLRIMATVPGISSAQRFKSTTLGFPPSLAMYSIESPAVFKDAYYLSVRGMGIWQSLIDQQYYKRNLFEGMAKAPPVPEGARLLLTERKHAGSSISGTKFWWLKSVGLDRSTPYRGIAVIDASHLTDLFDGTVAVYRPVTERFSNELND